MHGEAQRFAVDPTFVPNPRVGRHFYDIHELLGDAAVRDLLADRHEFDQILREISEFAVHFRRAREELEIRPEAGFASSPAFHADSDLSDRFCVAYEAAMPELYFGSDPFPPWADILERVAEAAELL